MTPSTDISSTSARKVLLLGSNDPRFDPRAMHLRKFGFYVDVARNVGEAWSLWRPSVYELILVDVRKHLPGEALDFCNRVKTLSPKQRIAFLVGPPNYLSLEWPGDVFTRDAAPHEADKPAKRHSAAA